MYAMTGGQMGNCTQFYGHMYLAYMFIDEKKCRFTSPTSAPIETEHFFGISSFTSHRSISFSLSVQFPTTAFVYIHRNQSSNRSTVNKVPIGKNKVPGR